MQSVRNRELTARELEILELMVEGLTNEEISKKLFIAASTARSHKIKIYDKLEVNNSSKAIVIALEKGIVKPKQEIKKEDPRVVILITLLRELIARVNDVIEIGKDYAER